MLLIWLVPPRCPGLGAGRPAAASVEVVPSSGRAPGACRPGALLALGGGL
ncbi:hypothetical protein WME98_25370 [Sorangium sp. So ce296]